MKPIASGQLLYQCTIQGFHSMTEKYSRTVHSPVRFFKYNWIEDRYLLLFDSPGKGVSLRGVC